MLKLSFNFFFGRLPELHFLLRSFPDADLFQMQRQLNLIWKSYFSSGTAVISTALAVIRDRIHLPPPPTEDDPSPSVFTESNPRMMLDQLPADLEPGEPLGPLEQAKPADAFRRNFSSVYSDRYSRYDIFHLLSNQTKLTSHLTSPLYIDVCGPFPSSRALLFFMF